MRFLKIGLSWLAVLAGLTLSVLSFGLLGVVPLADPYYPPSPQTWLAGLTLLFWGATAAVASVIAFHNRRTASLFYFIAAPLVPLGIWLSDMRLAEAIFDPREQYPASASAAIAFVPLILLGYFWSIAHRYHWPHMTAGRRLPMWAKLVLATAAGALFCGCVCATSVHIASSWELPGDCGAPPPFYKPRPDHAVFIARVVHVDSITGAMAVVQQRFGGLSWWNKIVFLKFAREKGTFFVDGRFEEGIVTGWLVPVLDLKCTGSAPIQDAGVELRLFRDSPHWDGVRIIGRVLEPPRRGWMPAVGATVVVEGPNGSIITVTDHDGIYDVSGLAPGHYSVRTDPYPDQTFREYSSCHSNQQIELKPGEVWGCTLIGIKLPK